MLRLLLGAWILFALAGCAFKAEPPRPGEKMFEEEDLYIMNALYMEQRSQFALAAEFYETLYERSGKPEYLHHMLQSLYSDRQFERIVAIAEAFGPDFDAKVARFEVNALLKLERLEAAKRVALALLAKTKALDDYLLVSQIYVKQQHYDTALKYLESAYAIDFDENILDQMAVVMYVNLDRKEEAIAQLESHSRLHGCSEQICNRLAAFYSDRNDVEGMLSTYLRIYEAMPDEKIARAIVNIYTYQKDYPRLTQFLEEAGCDDNLLLKLYINSQSFSKAEELARAMYDESGDPFYLGQSAIFRYETSEDKHDGDMLSEVMQTLVRVVRQEEDALFLNYLGYLMIDHDMNVTEGMAYVRRALAIDPESPFYLDSLAWGYYKQGQCEKALEMIRKVMEAMGKEDEEVDSHHRAILQCIQRKTVQ